MKTILPLRSALAPTAEDLSFVADALLALVGQDATRPFYTEIGFDRRQARNDRRTALDAEGALARVAAKAGGSTFAVECAAVLATCGLTARQREVFGLRLQGYTFEEIGRTTRGTKQGAMNVFVQALRKVGRKVRASPYVGLGECYREDCARRGRGR